jgi:hypothetical protein
MIGVPLYLALGGEAHVLEVEPQLVQYLAHMNPPPLGPYSSPVPRDLW